MEILEKHGATFVSVTQQFNTTTSLGRLTLNILLSFAQFEREIISERTRDKQVLARKRGKWTGGHIPLGYDLEAGCLGAQRRGGRPRAPDLRVVSGGPDVSSASWRSAMDLGWHNKQWTTKEGKVYGGHPMRKCHVYKMLANPLYAARIRADGEVVAANHTAVVDARTFDLVQEKLKENTRNPGTEHRPKMESLLRGLLYCSCCGSAMSPSYSSSKYRVGTGSEPQFKFRGVLQEEKPLRDWLQEVLMNCLGYYTFSFGRLKIGVRENSSTVEAFTIGNILFNSLQLSPLKPSFNHLTANFADEDYAFVNNSVTVYDIDYASQIGSGAGPLFLKSNVNLSGTFTKSQAARIISTRLREELGGTSIAEWKAARMLSFRTTVLALNTEPGMVCSMTHPDMPAGLGEFRVSGWKLNPDYSIDIQGRTTTDSMYDLVDGPKPADVDASPVPEEVFHDTGVPGIVNGTPKLTDYGSYVVDEIEILPDAAGNENITGATEITMGLYYVDELAVDLWGSLDAALDDTADPATVNCTVNPDTARVFKVGDFIVLNDEAADANNPGRRSYECAQITGPGAIGDVVPTGSFEITRAWPGVPAGQATFGTMRCAHLKHVRFYKLDMKLFTMAVKKGFFRTPGLPARIDAKIPSVCVVSVAVGVANQFGYGPFTFWARSPSQRTVHARGPDVLWRRIHVPDRRRALGAGQRRDPDEDPRRRLGPVRVRLRAGGDHGRPVRLRGEVLDRRGRDLERAGEDGHRADASGRRKEHLRFPR